MLPNGRYGFSEACSHDVYLRGLCGNCGIKMDPPKSTSVSMIHSVPELKVTEEYARKLGKADQEKLIQERKLVLLVDLDQTILHTTAEEIKNDPNVHSFKLWPGHPTYYTKLRPHLKEFLDNMSKIFELHIFTFACRLYAHKIASIIDPEQKYFGNRILSRNESKDLFSKLGNINDLFPCGDAMVCIIDDRADVWRDAGNLIQVKPYSYFKTSISDGAMLKPGSCATQEDESLDRDVDELEALLGDDDDETERTDCKYTENQGAIAEPDTESAGDKAEGDMQRQEGQDDVKTSNSCPTSSQQGDQASACSVGEKTVDPDAQGKDSEDGAPSERVKVEETVLPEDNDDHLLKMQRNLSHVHKKWYEELDERRSYLEEGERYQLPDIKDIIQRYLKRYH